MVRRMLDTEFLELQKIGQRLGYKVNIGNVWTPAGSLVQMQVHAGLRPEDTGIFLVLEVICQVPPVYKPV